MFIYGLIALLGLSIVFVYTNTACICVCYWG